MSVIEKNISNFIETQFPEIYREEGPIFVAFVKQYYEWLESSNNAIYHSRRILDYKDIDATADDFVIYFKEKFLKDIQFDTVSKTRQLVKHSLDLYRSKGTERSVDLFFRAVFGKPAEVYYPAEDIFRLSDGKWVKPKYLEVTPSDYNTQFVNKQIVGISSGAIAFVERFIKRKIKSQYINILYISSIVGEFQTGELITIQGETLNDLPTIIGSMTTLDIITGSSDFSVGDIVTLESEFGTQGKARVVNISDITGVVSFELEDSGWGYTANAEVLVSEKVLTLKNVLPKQNNVSYSPYLFFETLKQPLANVVYKNANATLSLANGDQLFTYYSNNVIAGRGVVITAVANTTTNGEVFVSEVVGDLGPVVEPAANLAGTVAVSEKVTPLTGYAAINTTSANVNGTGSDYVSEATVGSLIQLFAYNANNTLIGSQFKKITSITNSTQLVVDSNLTFASTNTILRSADKRSVVGTSTNFTSDFAYGDTIAIFSNSTNYIFRTVNAVANATYLTVQEDITFTNAAANYADTIVNNFIYTTSNTVKANIHSRSDRSVTSNVIGSSSNLTLTLVNSSATFTNTHNVIFQLNSNNDQIANATLLKVNSQVGGNATLSVINAIGVFQPNTSLPIRVRYANGTVSSITANLASMDTSVGVISIVNSFVSNQFVYGVTSQSNATIERISSGILADFSISNTLQFSESYQINGDFVRDYLYIPLDSESYGFPYFPTANGQTQYLSDIFTNTSVTIGGVASLTGINPGKNYDTKPFVTIYEPKIVVYDLHDYVMQLSNATTVFSTGEIVEQAGGAKGIVRQANTSLAIIKRIQFANVFDTSQALVGQSTGSTANIVSISLSYDTLPLGLNSVVVANVQTAEGTITSLEVVDSGFGYQQGENANFYSSDGTRSGLAKIQLGKKGISEGFYRNKKGFLSDSKKIFDGEYYQDYSYEVRTSVTADKYTEMLKKVLHVAGTKQFSAVVFTSSGDMESNISSSITKE